MMRKAFLIAGAVVLLALAFLAGRLTGRGQFFVGGPPRFGGDPQASFVVDGSPQFGESFVGEVTSLNESSITVQGEDEEMTFEFDANTRFISFGESVAIQVGDPVDVRYSGGDQYPIAASVTLTDYLNE